jgi:hypothetical protein
MKQLSFGLDKINYAFCNICIFYNCLFLTYILDFNAYFRDLES